MLYRFRTAAGTEEFGANGTDHGVKPPYFTVHRRFPIDHAVLKRDLSRRIGCAPMLWLLA
jgi:hypothetical protein